MRNLMKFGIVLVVLAMVTSNAFARNDWEGSDGDTWFNLANWDEGYVPNRYGTPDGDKEDTRIDAEDEVILVDLGYDPLTGLPASVGKDDFELREGILQIGTSEALRGDATTVRVNFTVYGDLEMSDDRSSDESVLDIVNGSVTVNKKSEDVGEDGNIRIIIEEGCSLLFEDGMYFGDSNDGTNSTYDLDIAGDFTCEGDRLEHRGGHLTINLTGDGTVDCTDETTRLSSDNDSMATININTGVGDTGSAVYETDKVELGQRDDGVTSPYTYSLAINIGGNGTWDGGGEDIKDQDKGQIFILDVTGNGSFTCDELDINDTDSEIHITMDSGLIDVENDIDMEAGTIVITGGEFNVDDDLKLGDKGVATMTVSGTADVWVDDLYMGKDSKLTINGVRMDLDDLKDTDDFDGSIEINIGGELVIKNAGDPDDWDEIADLIDAGQITTSSGGMVIVWDYGVSHSGKLTVYPAFAVTVDVKPGVCPNPLRVNLVSKGNILVAIAGSEYLDVEDIDPATIRLEGVAPGKVKTADVTIYADLEECDCGDLGSDGYPDLTLKFSRTAVLNALEVVWGDITLIEHRKDLALTLKAYTYDGILLQGKDCFRVLNRGLPKPVKP